jgi:hypothetical protein
MVMTQALPKGVATVPRDGLQIIFQRKAEIKCKVWYWLEGSKNGLKVVKSLLSLLKNTRRKCGESEEAGLWKIMQMHFVSKKLGNKIESLLA